MDESMIERVARALFDCLHGDTHTGGWDFGTGDVNVSAEQKDRFRKIARAAIAALAETPSKEMRSELALWRYTKAHPDQVIRSIILAALTETPSSSVNPG